MFLRQLALIVFTFALLAPLHSEETESDPRVPAKGGSWGVRKAKINDPKLPHVLLIGDSILSGYLGRVRKDLDGKANCDAWVTPSNQSSPNIPAMLAEIASGGHYDVIHFNMGLHGWQKDRIPDGQFEPLTHQLVQTIRKTFPGAKLIWATTTPVSKKEALTELDPDVQSILEEHNKMALKVMKEEGDVLIDDLDALMKQHLDLHAGDGFHWNGDGKTLQGNQVAEVIGKAITAGVASAGAGPGGK